jgi:hypothetical protein
MIEVIQTRNLQFTTTGNNYISDVGIREVGATLMYGPNRMHDLREMLKLLNHILLQIVKNNMISVAQNLQLSLGLTIVNYVMGTGVLSRVWVSV